MGIQNSQASISQISPGIVQTANAISRQASKYQKTAGTFTPDTSAPCFTSFLSKNFNSDICLFAQKLEFLDSQACRQARDKYAAEIDSTFGHQLLHALGWQDPANISFRGKFGTDAVGRQASIILGLENPDENRRKPGKLQIKLYSRHGTLVNFLNSKYPGLEPQAAFFQYVKSLESCQASVKNCIYVSLRESFGAEIDAGFRAGFLEKIGWLDPMRIPARGEGYSLSNKGKSVALLLNLERTSCLKDLQLDVFKKVHPDFKAYVASCHGTVEMFLDALEAIPNSSNRADFISALVKAYDGQVKTREFQEKMLRHYNLIDPMTYKPVRYKPEPRVWAAFDLLGVGQAVHGRKSLDKTYNVQKYVFSHFHKTFTNYIEACHDGKIENFMSALLAKQHFDRTHFTGLMHSALKKGNDAGKYEAEIYAKIGWTNPISIRFGSEFGAEALRGTLSAMFGLGDLKTNRRAQSLILSQLHGSFSNYLKNCYNSDFFAFSDGLAKLHPSAKHTFLASVHNAFPEFWKNPEESAFVLSQFSAYDPLFLKFGKTRDSKTLTYSDIYLLGILSGSKTKSKILPGILLLSNYGSFEGYMQAHYNGSTGKFRRAMKKLPPKKRDASIKILRYAFAQKKPEYGKFTANSGISFTKEFLTANSSRPPLEINQVEAVSKLGFELNFVKAMQCYPEVSRAIRHKQAITYGYHYPRMALKWAEAALEESESIGTLYDAAIKSHVLSRIGAQNGGQLAYAAARLCLAKTAQCRREAFASTHLPELVGVLIDFFGPQFPHALAFVARLKSKESEDGIDARPDFKNTWEQIIQNLKTYIEVRHRNMNMIMRANGFELKSEAGFGFYEMPLRNRRGVQVRVIVPDNRFLTPAYVIGETQVPESSANLTSHDSAKVKHLETYLSSLRTDLLTFCEAIDERLNPKTSNAAPAKSLSEMSETTVQVLDAASKRDGQPVPEVFRHLGLEMTTIYKHLNVLRGKELVDRKYFITEEGRKFLSEQGQN
ncbi:MAG: helix-turn-helix transcriptional regulator [Candidatus Micrarchaeia archaeon]